MVLLMKPCSYDLPVLDTVIITGSGMELELKISGIHSVWMPNQSARGRWPFNMPKYELWHGKTGPKIFVTVIPKEGLGGTSQANLLFYDTDFKI